jgi:hypothetical protein
MGEAKRRRERELKFSPEAADALRQFARGEHQPQGAPPPPHEVLTMVAKARAMLRQLRAEDRPEPFVIDPVSGKRLGLFDPETDALLDVLERAALAKQRRPLHAR